MASWSKAGSVITLTLDGSESGPYSRSHVFTGADGIVADEQHTVYLIVNPSIVAVRAFLEVVGGDQTEATIVGPQTLRARGDADGSANLTVRFGVLAGEGGGGGVLDTFTLEGLASLADIVAAGWTLVNNSIGSSSNTVALDAITVDSVNGSTQSVKFNITHVAWNGGEIWYQKLYTGLTPGDVYDIEVVRLRTHNKPWFSTPTLKLNTGGGAYVGGQPDDAWTGRTAYGTVDGFGNLLAKFGMSFTLGVGVNWDTWFDGDIIITKRVGGGADIDFQDLTFCVGSGVGDGGTGLGDPEDPDDPESPPVDPIPDPPDDFEPWTGTRRMALFNAPIAGLDYFNGSVKIATRSNLVDVANIAIAANNYLYLFMDSQSAWLDPSGKWQFDLWKAAFDRILNDTRAYAALVDLIDAGLAAHFINDEPYTKVKRYGWGSGIPLVEIERCCQYSRLVLPDMPTMISLRPTSQKWWMVRHIDELDWLACFYSENEGDCATFRDQNIARAIVLNHGLLLAPHYAHIQYPSSGSRYATPTQVVKYGTICATPPSSNPTYRTIGMLSWKFLAAMYAQAGFVEATHTVRNVLQSYD